MRRLKIKLHSAPFIDSEVSSLLPELWQWWYDFDGGKIRNNVSNFLCNRSDRWIPVLGSRMGMKYGSYQLDKDYIKRLIDSL